jgi:hypothetical protein
MVAQQIGSLPRDQGRLVGIITETDISEFVEILAPDDCAA